MRTQVKAGTSPNLTDMTRIYHRARKTDSTLWGMSSSNSRVLFDVVISICCESCRQY